MTLKTYQQFLAEKTQLDEYSLEPGYHAEKAVEAKLREHGWHRAADPKYRNIGSAGEGAIHTWQHPEHQGTIVTHGFKGEWYHDTKQPGHLMKTGDDYQDLENHLNNLEKE